MTAAWDLAVVEYFGGPQKYTSLGLPLPELSMFLVLGITSNHDQRNSDSSSL